MNRARQGGFTIIELMIVLGGLSLLSVIGYVIYGNINEKINLSGAAQIINNQMNQLVTSGASYIYFEGKTLNPSTWQNDLLTTASVKNIPIPTEKAKDPSYSGDFGYVMDNTTYSSFGVTGIADTVILLNGVSDTVCKQINKSYTALGKTNSWKTIPSAPQYTENMQCFSSGSGYTALQVMFYDN